MNAAKKENASEKWYFSWFSFSQLNIPLPCLEWQNRAIIELYMTEDGKVML